MFCPCQRGLLCATRLYLKQSDVSKCCHSNSYEIRFHPLRTAKHGFNSAYCFLRVLSLCRSPAKKIEINPLRCRRGGRGVFNFSQTNKQKKACRGSASKALSLPSVQFLLQPALHYSGAAAKNQHALCLSCWRSNNVHAPFSKSYI